MLKKISQRLDLNNFDLIRLFAAMQVALTHATGHLGVRPEFMDYLLYFPGVPIFFFISGYLIYQSYENNKHKNLNIFYKNRILRIYPALFLCFFVSLTLIYFTGYFETKNISIKDFIVWIITSLSFFQFYNPDFMRSYGTGVLNGSLWTISVELQFYILAPFIFYILKNLKFLFFIIFLLLIGANYANSFLSNWSLLSWKIFGVSFLPWLYMFMFGAYLSSNSLLQTKILNANLFFYFTAYILQYYFSIKYNLGIGHEINLISYLLLACLIFKLAFTMPKISTNILNGNDISYGIYIYHMPIVNFLLFYNIEKTITSLTILIFATFVVAILSWYYVEKPSLKLKNKTIRKIF